MSTPKPAKVTPETFAVSQEPFGLDNQPLAAAMHQNHQHAVRSDQFDELGVEVRRGVDELHWQTPGAVTATP